MVISKEAQAVLKAQTAADLVEVPGAVALGERQPRQGLPPGPHTDH